MKYWCIRLFTWVGIFGLAGISVAWAQQDSLPSEKKGLYENEKPTIVLDTVASAKEQKEPKKKWKKRVFYGIKTRKNFTKKGAGDRMEIELFYTLKSYRDPDPYLQELREIYWYNSQEKKIEKRPIKEGEARYAQILHGPYKRMRDGEVVEEGIFFVGAKHGRWVQYSGKEDLILLDKEKYRKGWSSGTKVTYYDTRRTKVDEVFPYNDDGIIEGDYYKFHENGQIAVRGEYDDGSRVGKWTEYYPFLRRTYKELQYPETPYKGEKEPILLREYDRSMKVVYDWEQSEKERLQKEEAEKKAEWRKRALEGTLDPDEKNPTP